MLFSPSNLLPVSTMQINQPRSMLHRPLNSSPNSSVVAGGGTEPPRLRGHKFFRSLQQLMELRREDAFPAGSDAVAAGRRCLCEPEFWSAPQRQPRPTAQAGTPKAWVPAAGSPDRTPQTDLWTAWMDTTPQSPCLGFTTASGGPAGLGGDADDAVLVPAVTAQGSQSDAEAKGAGSFLLQSHRALLREGAMLHRSLRRVRRGQA